MPKRKKFIIVMVPICRHNRRKHPTGWNFVCKYLAAFHFCSGFVQVCALLYTALQLLQMTKMHQSATYVVSLIFFSYVYVTKILVMARYSIDCRSDYHWLIFILSRIEKFTNHGCNDKDVRWFFFWVSTKKFSSLIFSYNVGCLK
jgi:hypothetical protein